MTSPQSRSPLPPGESDWLERLKHNQRAITTGAIVLAVVAGAIWLYTTSQRRKEAFAAQELGRARAAAEAGNLPLAASDLTRLAERFSGTRSAEEAVVLLNQIRLLQGQTQLAVTAVEEFLRARHPEEVRASAYALLGGGLEDLGKSAEAGEAYRNAAGAARQDFLKAQYLLDAGRALTAASDTTRARAAYQEVLTRFAELDQSVEARLRLSELGGDVPPSAPRGSGRS